MMTLGLNFDLVSKNKNNSQEIALSSTFNEQTLYRSCLVGDLERAQYVLRDTSSDIDLNRQNDDGYTLLHLGCLSNFYGLVQLLLQHRANVRLNDNGGRTCLHYACIKGHRAIVTLLLKNLLLELDTATRTEFLHLKDEHEKSALEYACEKGHLAIVELFLVPSLLLVDEDLRGPLYHACIEGHLDVCHLLLKQGQAIVHDILKPSVVQTICSRGYLQVLRLLVQSMPTHQPLSTELSRRRDGSNSVLFHSLSTFDVSLVRDLLERQARMTEKDIHDLVSLLPIPSCSSSSSSRRLRLENYFNCIELLFHYRLNFEDAKISKYFLRQLCEQCSSSHMAEKIRRLFAVSLYTGCIPLHRRATLKWCGEISVATERTVNLSDVHEKTSNVWSLTHILRLKIKKSLRTYSVEELKNLPFLQEHHVNFLAFNYL